jgi:hypothetical protein
VTVSSRFLALPLETAPFVAWVWHVHSARYGPDVAGAGHALNVSAAARDCHSGSASELRHAAAHRVTPLAEQVALLATDHFKSLFSWSQGATDQPDVLCRAGAHPGDGTGGGAGPGPFAINRARGYDRIRSTSRVPDAELVLT